MIKLTLTLKLLASLLAGSPEGFFPLAQLQDASLLHPDELRDLLLKAQADGILGLINDFVFDPSRLTPLLVRDRSQWFQGSLPELDKKGRPIGASIAGKKAKREQLLSQLNKPAYNRLLHTLDKTPGFALPEELCSEIGDETVLREMIRRGLLAETRDFVFDPLRISAKSLNQWLKRQKRIRKRDRQEELRARLVAAFPTWRHDRRLVQQLQIHTGPTNSGKTYHALQALAASGAGWYLAPLRLLAYEVFERLNAENVPCHLLTGEEAIFIDGAQITAATIEMFDVQRSGNCVVIDEAFMIADAERGWAWTRALMEGQSPEIRLICSPAATNLIERLAEAADLDYVTTEHKRLTPLKVARHPWLLEELPSGTILVAFSRSTVLQLKAELERYGRRVSVIYGALPPEVRHKQAALFASRETEICVATDAVGMGLNLPADRVCFFELEKFDGRERRILSASEFHQIAGRAGRYGLSEYGEVGATTVYDLKFVRSLFDQEPIELIHARVSPSATDLALIPGHLSARLQKWQALASIPDDLHEIVKPADLEARIQLSAMLSQKDIEKLGLEASLQLINAPARENSQEYWYSCARAIIDGMSLPLPALSPYPISNSSQMSEAEAAVACADIYLWLSQRKEFNLVAPQVGLVQELRRQFAEQIEIALLKRLDTAKRCKLCNRTMPLNHRYETCKYCYFRQRELNKYEAGSSSRRGKRSTQMQARRPRR